MAEQEIEITEVEEQFLIEAETEQHKKPSFDARALRQIGLTEPEVSLLQVFFMKARGADFNARRFTKSECLQGLVSALKYLPKTDESGKITPESYKASDNIHAGGSQSDGSKWSEAFRHEFGHARIWSHKERREPALLAVLAKVFDWVERFQKGYGLYQALPQWLQDGMAGDFRSDSWIGSDLYEGTKTPEQYPQEIPANGSTAGGIAPPRGEQEIQEPKATDKQKAFLARLHQEQGGEIGPLDINVLTKREASRQIDMLLEGRSPAPAGARPQ